MDGLWWIVLPEAVEDLFGDGIGWVLCHGHGVHMSCFLSCEMAVMLSTDILEKPLDTAPHIPTSSDVLMWGMGLKGVGSRPLLVWDAGWCMLAP